jgi:DNA (cytosine-5)-methyltransferase 1
MSGIISRMPFTVLELCAGGGGQALGLEMAGFRTSAAVEIEPQFCETLRLNRPAWNVIQSDLRTFDARPFRGVDLVAGGVPCPPFSIAGKQLGKRDDRDLFPEALRVVREAEPKAVMLENVPGFASSKFAAYRRDLFSQLRKMGYVGDFHVLNSSDFGVPQLRPRFVLVAIQNQYADAFVWPGVSPNQNTVGMTLRDLMAARGWQGAIEWAKRALGIAPTLVGGSKKHGGPDLGPTRAKRQWARLGVDGLGLADAPPDVDFPVAGMPRLTVRMAARIQGFPDSWNFAGRKTIAYRQVGNAFPPPVAAAVGAAIHAALAAGSKRRRSQPVQRTLVEMTA